MRLQKSSPLIRQRTRVLIGTNQAYRTFNHIQRRTLLRYSSNAPSNKLIMAHSSGAI